MRLVDRVVGVDEKLDEVIHLRLVRVVEIVKGLHGLELARIGADLFTGILTSRENELERTAHIEERGVMPAVGLRGCLRLYATDDIVVARVRESYASGEKRGNDHLVVVIRGQTDTRSRQLSRADQELVRRTVPYANGERRRGEENVHSRIDAHEGNVVGRIDAVCVLTACDEVLEEAVACKALCGSGVTAFVEVVELDPNAVHQLLREFTGDRLFLQILLEVRIHVLVKTTGRDRVTAGFHLQKHLDKPEGLTSLVEVSRAEFGNAFAVESNATKLSLSFEILTTVRHCVRKLCVALRVGDDRLTADDNGVEEMMALCVIAVAEIQLRESRLRFLDDTAVAHAQYLSVINGNVSDAVVEIVARRKNIVRDRGERLGSHIGGRKITCGLALPIFMHFSQSSLCLLGNVEGVRSACFDSIEFCLQPFKRIFREGLTAARRLSCASDDQFLITNGDRDILQNMRERFRAAKNNRLTLRFAVRFRQQNSTVRFDFRHFFVQVFDKTTDSVSLLDIFCIECFQTIHLRILISFYFTTFSHKCQLDITKKPKNQTQTKIFTFYPHNVSYKNKIKGSHVTILFILHYADRRSFDGKFAYFTYFFAHCEPDSVSQGQFLRKTRPPARIIIGFRKKKPKSPTKKFFLHSEKN